MNSTTRRVACLPNQAQAVGHDGSVTFVSERIPILGTGRTGRHDESR